MAINSMRKKKGLKLIAEIEDVSAKVEALQKAEFTEDEIQQIFDAAAAAAEDETPEKTHFEEWNCEISNSDKGPVVTPLKMTRKCVKISQEQATILNDGAKHGSNTYAKFYFPAGSVK